MGCLLSCLACQAVSCCTGMACNCCGKALACNKAIATRIMYVVFFFLAAIASFILKTWSYKILTFVPELDNTCKNDDHLCIGTLSAARVAFAMCLFHGVMALLMIRVSSSKDFRAQIQDGWWVPKLLLIVAVTVASFFIPNEFFIGFSWVSVFGAGVFIIIQLMLLIEFAYSWAESWLQKYEENESKLWFALLLIATIVLYVLALALTILIYVFFYKGSECWMNAVFPTLNVFICLVYSGLSVHPKVQDAHPSRGTGLLQSGVVALYSTYLIWSAVSSEPTDDSFQCNPLDNSKGSLSTVFMGAAFTIIAVCFSTVRTASKGDDLFQSSSSSSTAAINDEEKADEGKALLTSVEHEEAEDDDTDDAVEEKVGYNFSFFHLTFLLGSMFVFMLITDWQIISGTGNDKFKVDHGFVAVWVKIVTSWLVALLYAWTLVAPALLPGREWS